MLNSIKPHIVSLCIFLLPRIFGIMSDICTLVPGISLRFMRCKQYFGLRKVLTLWTSATIRLWQSIRRGECISRSLISYAHPRQFWGDVLTVCYLINRMPSWVLDVAFPHSLLFSSSSSFSLPLKVFWCICFVHNLGPRNDKLGPCSTKCVFLDYSTTQKGYHFYGLVLQCCFTPIHVY
jgi:hypothetical protein